MKKYVFNNKGISLVEVLIVLTIIGITGAIIVPSTGIVQRNRLKSMASQIAMDIKKVRFFAQTHEAYNTYKIEFDTNKYILHGTELSDIDPITDGIVQITPIAIKTDDTEHPINEIQFDNRGRIIVKSGSEDISYNMLKDIKITLKIDKYQKEVTVRPLAAHTYIGDTVIK